MLLRWRCTACWCHLALAWDARCSAAAAATAARAAGVTPGTAIRAPAAAGSMPLAAAAWACPCGLACCVGYVAATAPPFSTGAAALCCCCCCCCCNVCLVGPGGCSAAICCLPPSTSTAGHLLTLASTPPCRSGGGGCCPAPASLLLLAAPAAAASSSIICCSMRWYPSSAASRGCRPGRRPRGRRAVPLPLPLAVAAIPAAASDAGSAAKLIRSSHCLAIPLGHWSCGCCRGPSFLLALLPFPPLLRQQRRHRCICCRLLSPQFGLPGLLLPGLLPLILLSRLCAGLKPPAPGRAGRGGGSRRVACSACRRGGQTCTATHMQAGAAQLAAQFPVAKHVHQHPHPP